MSRTNNLESCVVNFFNKKKEYRSLSNFWEGDVEVNGRLYESGEHCFHGEKYLQLSEICTHENRKKFLFDHGCKFMKPCMYTKGSDVKKMGGKKGLRLNDDELRLWCEIGVVIQYKISKYKLEKYEEVRNDLIKSKGKILVHPAMRCSEEKVKTMFWEGKGVIIDGEIVVLGKNKLGNIWMTLRDDIC